MEDEFKKLYDEHEAIADEYLDAANGLKQDLSKAKSGKISTDEYRKRSSKHIKRMNDAGKRLNDWNRRQTDLEARANE